MAKQINQGAPQMEETLSKNEAMFLKYQKQIIAAVAAVVIIVAGCIIYHHYVAVPSAQKASTALAKGQQYFQNEDYLKALNGDSIGFVGFLKIAEEGGDAGNLANLYAGLSYAQLDSWSEAVKYLEKFNQKDDAMISPAMIGAMGNAYAHLDQLDKAVSLLKEAAAKADNNSLSPTFLIQAGEILESQNKKDEALKLYQEVKDKYFNSMAYQTIDAYIERASAK